jgi:outer membrane protein assembly factor BamA
MCTVIRVIIPSIRGEFLLKRLLVCVCFLSSFPLNGQTGGGAHRAPVTVRNIVFENAALLSAQERRELTKRIRQDDDSPGDIANMAEERVREACQDNGYFKVRVSAVAQPVAGSAANRRYDIVIKVIDSGQRYWLREIHFIGLKTFSEAELLELMPIRPGEIFSRAKVVKGLEAVWQHFESAGYVNFTSIPNTEFDEADAGVRLHIDVDEGNLFRWGKLHITGLDTGKTQELMDRWEDMRGTPYSPKALRDFCARFFRPVPLDTDPVKYTKREVNEKTGTVDISIAFVSPPWTLD